MTVRIKDNRSSEFRNDMGCSQCNTDKKNPRNTWIFVTRSENASLRLNIPKDHKQTNKQTKTKSAIGGRSIRVETVPKSAVVDLLDK